MSGAAENSGSSSPHHVVIVGAGFGGLAAAQGLAGESAVRVTLIDRRNHHVFQPLLYQVASAVLSPSEVAQPIRGILGRSRNIQVLLGEVQRVDTVAKRVHLTDCDALPYDTLVLATGATHSYFGRPEWERWAPGLKTLDDARRIRANLLLAFERAERTPASALRERLMTFVVIGGGPTGVEMAGAIAGLARQALAPDFRAIDPGEARILLIEAGPRILNGFPEELSSYAQRALEKPGVTVMIGQPVQDISAEGVTVSGRMIPTACVVWGAGLKASPVAEWLGIAPSDRIGHVRVGADLSVKGADDVYAIGDVALAFAEDGSALPGLAQVAHQQGRYLGRALRNRIVAGTTPPPFRFRSRGNLAVIGHNEAVVQWDGLKLKGFPAWLVWGLAHVYLLNGFQNRLIVTLRWLWAYVTFQRGARIIPEERTTTS
jgi:NADH dehydrogenase